MNEDLEQFIHDWLEGLLMPGVEYAFKFDTKVCYAFVKYLMDRTPPDFTPTHYELEKVYRMYELLPASLHDVADEIVTIWKLKVYNVPDKSFAEALVDC